MAIFQFEIELLPCEWFELNKALAIKMLFVGDEYEISIAWKGYSPTVSPDLMISEILMPGNTWHDDLYVWGQEDHNDIQLWRNCNRIESITIRFDLRENVDDLVLKVVNLANRLNCCFLIPSTKEVISSNDDSLKKAISLSRAAKFVSDPEKFLDDLKK